MIKTVCVCPPEVVRRNRDYAASLGLPRLAALPALDMPLAIVGGGASARDEIATLRHWPGHIMAINGAHDWLVSEGRAPDSVILLDPHPVMAGMVRKPTRHATWYVASMCDRVVFEALRGLPVVVWESPQDDTEALELSAIAGGCTAMTRAPLLAAQVGYRDISIFGADSCFRDGTTHAYGANMAGGDPTIPAHAVRIVCDGETWLTELGLVAQAEYLAAMLPHFAGGQISARLIGRHLASAMLAAGGKWTFADGTAAAA